MWRARAQGCTAQWTAQLQEEAHLRLGAEAAEGVGGLIGDLKEVAADTLRDSK